MAIQIGGTTVIDNSRNLTNIASIFSCTGIASQAEAEAGTSSTKLMTPQRVAQAIAALSGGSVINRIQRGTTSISSPGAGAPWLSGLGNGPDGGGTTNVPITSVNTSKSFISSSNRSGDVFNNGYRTQYSPNKFGYAVIGSPGGGAIAQLTSSTNLEITSAAGLRGQFSNPSPGQNYPGISAKGVISWEVIEFV